MRRKPYPSDLTDEQWALLKPLLPASTPRGRPRKTDLREIVNALFYHAREGGTWRALPHDFPAWQTVYHYFQWWEWMAPGNVCWTAFGSKSAPRRVAPRPPAPPPSTVSRSRRLRGARSAAPTGARTFTVANAISW